MFRPSLLGVLLLLALSTTLFAKSGVIFINDGRHIAGDVDERGDTVSVTTHGIAAGFPRSSITDIQYVDDIQKEFNDRLGKLPDSDVRGKMNLAHWAMDREQYDLARQAAAAAQAADPTNTEVDALIVSIQNLQSLQAKTQAAEAAATQPSAAAPVVAATAPSEMPNRCLAEDDINLIRQAELRPSDVVRVNFLNNVRDRYLALPATDATTFNTLSPTGQALAIISTGDPSLARDVKIISDPASLLEFRNQIQPRLLTGCAASGCHGGSGNTGFFLYPDAGNTAVWYTNFYILQTYRTTITVTDIFGTGPAVRPMIDRARPNNSPLAQFSLPPNLAANPHPKVPGWKPTFLTDQDPEYARLIDWMGGMLKPVVEDDYGIQFALPTSGSTTKPTEAAPEAPAPATMPAPADNIAPASVPDGSPSMLNK